ncbi:hypothetical protein BJF78_28870 [Pseudonocardia sp. CNS-139]|nr:hypothetical protein BJF78_28870 [Pseudonocardia sp. CNS-139]
MWSPAGTSLSTEQSSQADAPCSSTAPPSVVSKVRPANRSPVRAAIWRQARSWAAPRTLTPSRGRPASRGQVVDVCCTQTETSGGSIETDVNELAAIPTGSCGPIAQTAVTPLGKHP